MHGARGAFFAKAGGADVRSGFVGGMTEGMLGGYIEKHAGPENIQGGTLAAAFVGGAVSEATGGKFANGAATAAMGYLFNQMGSYLANPGQAAAAAKNARAKQVIETARKKATEEIIDKTTIVGEASACAGVCAKAEVGYNGEHGAISNAATGFGLKGVLGGGFNFNVYSNGSMATGDVSTYNYVSGQLGPLGVEANHRRIYKGRDVYNVDVKIMFPGGLGADAGTGFSRY